MSAVLVYSCFREQIPHYYSFIDEVAGIKDKRNKFFKKFKEKANPCYPGTVTTSSGFSEDYCAATVRVADDVYRYRLCA